MRTRFLAVSTVAFLAAGCDPAAPVQSSDVDSQIDGAVAVHAADASTHTNLLLNAGNISGEFDSDQIADDAVGNSELAINSVGSIEIADGTITIGDMGTGSVGVTQLVDQSITGSKLAFGTVDAARMAPNAVTGGLGGVLMDNTVTADDIGTGAVASAEIADNTVATGDILDNTIANGDIAANTITAGSIANDAIGAGELADDAVDTNAIADAAVDDTKLATNSVITAKIAATAVDDTKLATNAVTNAKIASLAVTQAKIDSDFVGRRVDAMGGAGANLNTVFVFTEPSGGAAIDITIVGACESTEAGSIVRLGDQTAACPDVGNNNAIDGTPVLFRLVFNASNENVTFSYDAGANNDTVAWEIFSFTVSGAP